MKMSTSDQSDYVDQIKQLEDLKQDCSDLIMRCIDINDLIKAIGSNDPSIQYSTLISIRDSRRWIDYFKDITLLLDRLSFYFVLNDVETLTKDKARMIKYQSDLHKYTLIKTNLPESFKNIDNDMYEYLIREPRSQIFEDDNNGGFKLNKILTSITYIGNLKHRYYPDIGLDMNIMYIEGRDLMECFKHSYKILCELYCIIISELNSKLDG